jgi:hypothetical protein
MLIDLPGLNGSILVAFIYAAYRYRTLAVAHAFQKIGYSRALQAGVDIITLVPIDGVRDIEFVSMTG